MKKKCRTNSQDKSVEKVNMQNNEGEGKASGDIEPEKVAGMEKEGTEKSGEEETDNKTAEINEWANIGKERKETPPLNLCIVHLESNTGREDCILYNKLVRMSNI
uniref:Uncharacterized protein n=1 Tax=Vitis vinifera TaxID=29760 RepID=F6H7I2_VITVI